MSSNKTDSQNTDTHVKLIKRPWFQNLIWGIGFLIVFLTLRPIMQGDVSEGKAPIVNTTSITGKSINLQTINQPTLVHFWATWCPICNVTKEGIESVAKDYPVINIATSSGDTASLLAYAKENNLNPDNIVNDEDGQRLKAFGARAVPADFIIDREGNIAFVEVGYSTSWGLRFRLWWLSL